MHLFLLRESLIELLRDDVLDADEARQGILRVVEEHLAKVVAERRDVLVDVHRLAVLAVERQDVVLGIDDRLAQAHCRQEMLANGANGSEGLDERGARLGQALLDELAAFRMLLIIARSAKPSAVRQHRDQVWATSARRRVERSAHVVRKGDVGRATDRADRLANEGLRKRKNQEQQMPYQRDTSLAEE